MAEAVGTVWTAEYGEVSELQAFRVGYRGTASAATYFPLTQLGDLIEVLTAASSAAAGSASYSGHLLAKVAFTGFRAEISVFPVAPGAAPLLTLDAGLVSDLIDVLTDLEGQISSSAPQDWDDTKPNGLPEAQLDQIAASPQLSAAYAPLRAMYLSQYGVVADATDATIAANTATDCTARVQAAFDACIDGSGNVIGYVVHDVPCSVPTEGVLISAPVDMNGASLVGLDKYLTRIIMDPRVPYADWSIGVNPNDLAGLYAKNKTGWQARRVGFDGADTYTQPLVAWGGSHITFDDCYARRIAKCGFQFMGARSEDDDPVTYSTMKNLVAEDTVWSFVMDGQCEGCKIVDCESLTPTARHVSIDPTAAYGGEDANRDLTIRGVKGFGYRTPPAGWASFPVVDDAAQAIAIGADSCHVTGSISDIIVQEWWPTREAFELHNFAGTAKNLQAYSSTTVTEASAAALQIGGNDQQGIAEISGIVTEGYALGARYATGAKYTLLHDCVFSGATTVVNSRVAGEGSRAWSNSDGGADEIISTVSEPGAAAVPLASNAANRAFKVRVWQGGRISKIGVYVATSGGNIDVGVYSNLGKGRDAYAHIRKASSGSVALSSTGWIEIPLTAPVQVQPGDWIVIALDGTTAQLHGTTATRAQDDSMKGYSHLTGSAFPLPGNFGSQGITERAIWKAIGVA